MFRARLARGSRGARLTWSARRASRSRRLRVNVLRAAVLLIGHSHCNGFAGKHHLILGRARLTWWSRWARLTRVTRWSRLTRLTLTFRPRLCALTRCALLTLRFGESGIHVTVYVPRFVIIVTAIAAAIAIVHVIHFSEP